MSFSSAYSGIIPWKPRRSHVLDLPSDRSVVRRLPEGGSDVYLIDREEPSSPDASLTLDDYVTRYMDNCVDVVRERAGVGTLDQLAGSDTEDLAHRFDISPKRTVGWVEQAKALVENP